MSEALTSYLDKCRCCYASIESEDNASLINKIIEKRFYYLSNIEVSAIFKEKFEKKLFNN